MRAKLIGGKYSLLLRTGKKKFGIGEQNGGAAEKLARSVRNAGYFLL